MYILQEKSAQHTDGTVAHMNNKLTEPSKMPSFQRNLQPPKYLLSLGRLFIIKRGSVWMM